MIGDRIKKARNALGLCQRELASQANVSAMAISKYERNKSMPSSKVTLSLANSLGVRVEYFFRQTDVHLDDIEFREDDKLPNKEKEKMFADIEDQIERLQELEEFLPTIWSKALDMPDNLPKTIDSYAEIEDLTNQLRKNWGLGLNAIPDLIDTLERKGIKVFITQYDGNQIFNGLSAKVSNSPIIVVGHSWPGDRQRFTIAHELGHLVLKNKLSQSLDLEKACNQFAGSFLIPNSSVINVLGNKRHWLEPQELMLIKQEWGISMGCCIHRANSLKIITLEVTRKLWKLFRENDWKEKEPDPQYQNEETHYFKHGVYHALAENLISESKAAELLGVSVMKLHACRKMKCLDGTANQ